MREPTGVPHWCSFGGVAGMSASWLIDDDGNYWLEGSTELARHLRITKITDETSYFLLLNAGFARAVQHARVTIIEFAYETVSPNALGGLLYLLDDIAAGAVSFIQPGDKQTTRIFRPREEWLNYICSLIDLRRQAASYVSRSVPVALSPFFQRSDAAQQIVKSISDLSTRNLILDKLFGGMFTLVKIDANSGRPIISAVGSRIYAYDPTFMAAASGRWVGEIYDVDYGHWLSAHYGKVSEAGTPMADDIDATIKWSHQIPKLHRYSRFTIPIERGLSDRWVLSTTVRR